MSARATLREVQTLARRAVGIVRVSRQDEDAVSPADQRERIERECERLGLELVAVFDEPNVSGGADLEHRPGLRPALEMVEDGRAEVVIAAYFDRLFRSIDVQQEVARRIERAGGTLAAVDVGEIRTAEPTQWLSSGMLGLVSEYHRRTTGQRTETAKRKAVEEKRAPFPLPFYLRKAKDGTIEHDPRAVRALREAIELRVGGATIREAREHLHKRGVKVSYGGLQGAFRSPLLLGELRFGKYRNPDAFTPVITPETFRRLQRTRVPAGRRSKSERLLARLKLLRCASCGAALQAGRSKGTYPIYKHPSLMPCERPAAVSAAKAEAEVSAFVRERLKGLRGSASGDLGLEAAERELEQIEAERTATVEAFSGFEDVAAVREKMRALTERRDAAEERVEHLRAASIPVLQLDAQRDWDGISFDERRALIRAVVERVDVAPGHRPDKLTIQPRQ